MIAVVSALRGEIEHALAADTRVLYSVCGVGISRAVAHTKRLIASHKIDAMYFVGSAGALCPQLPRGTIAIPQRLMCASSAIRTRNNPEIRHVSCVSDALSTQTLAEIGLRTPHVTQRPLLTVDTAVVTRAERDSLFSQHGADTVDMEAWGVGWIAHQYDIPCTVIKYVTDCDAHDVHRFRTQLSQCAATLKSVLSVIMGAE